MSPFNTAESALDSLSSRFSDLQQPLRQPCPGEGATVDAVDARNAARAITASRLADWAYSAKAVAQAQADADGALMRAPSPADLEALGLQCELSNGSPAALAAYQSAGSERLAAKKAHTAATGQTTWPDSVTPADMPAPPTAPDPKVDKKSAGRDKTRPIGDGDGFKDEGDDRPVGDGFGGEGVDDDAAPDADDTATPATPATNSSVDPTASRPLPLDTPAPVSAEAAGTSLSADTSDPSTGARTGTLSNATSPAGSPTAPQQPQMAPIQPSPQVTGPRGGASPQLGQAQNGSRQAPAGPRPGQTGNDDTPPPARDTTFDALAAGTGGAALGIGGAHSATGAPTGPSTPSVPTAPSGATGVPTGPAPAHGATTPPPAPAPPPQGMGAGSTLRPPVAPSSSGETVHAATTRTPIYQADVDPSLDPLTADPSDLDWTPPTIPTEEKK